MGVLMTYEQWLDVRIAHGAVFHHISMRDFGGIVARAVLRGEINNERDEEPIVEQEDFLEQASIITF